MAMVELVDSKWTQGCSWLASSEGWQILSTVLRYQTNMQAVILTVVTLNIVPRNVIIVIIVVVILYLF